MREAYAPGADYSRPEFSPLFGDFSAFPPALIQVGTHEILYSDSERLAERMKAGRLLLPAGGVGEHVARFPDGPREEVRRGHGEHGALPE